MFRYIALKKILLKEQLHTIRHYYPKSLRFALIDILLGLCPNPYRICRKHRLGPYGETPPSTLHRIASFCNLTPSDLWFDLGSGRGKTCFWISLFIGCPSIGIDAIPIFTRTSRLLARLFHIPATFHSQNLHQADLSRATCIYLYSTCMSDASLASLIPKIYPNTKIITISAPLPTLTPLTSFPVTFPWGTTEAFLHQIPPQKRCFFGDPGKNFY